jgi:peptidoglycan/LPS O-acetylase OafA/YrhL
MLFCFPLQFRTSATLSNGSFTLIWRNFSNDALQRPPNIGYSRSCSKANEYPIGKRMNNKDHFLTLDGFRGIAAILVVLRHTLPYFGGNPFFSSYLSVDLFFLLSGAVLARSYEARLLNGMSLAAFMKIRLLRLYPLYFIGMCIGILASLVDAMPYKGHTLAAASFGLLLLPALYTHTLFPLNGPAWSLSSELIVNLVYGWKAKSLSNRVLIAVMAFCLLGLIAFTLYWPAHNFDAGFYRRTYYVSFLRVGFSFGAGVLLYRWYLRRATTIQLSNRNALLGIAGMTLVLTASPSASILPVYDALAVAIVFPLLVYVGMRFQPTGVLASLCKLLGIVSYPLYIVHSPLSELVQHGFLSATGRSVGAYAPLAGFVILVLLVAIAWSLHHFYDEPVRKAAAAWLARRTLAKSATKVRPLP